MFAIQASSERLGGWPTKDMRLRSGTFGVRSPERLDRQEPARWSSLHLGLIAEERPVFVCTKAEDDSAT